MAQRPSTVPIGDVSDSPVPQGPAGAATPSNEAVPDALTFVFTDIEGSTLLLERLLGGYGELLARHGEIIRESIARHEGREVDTQGDAFFVVFADSLAAVRFAADVQRLMAAEAWPDGVEVRLRIGMHSGQATLQRTGYVGLAVHHGARVAAAAHGGQVLLSRSTAARIGGMLSSREGLRSLGEFRLKDIREPIELIQLEAQGLAEEFPIPRSLDEADAPPKPGDAPYMGLAQFEEEDAERFFGREAVVDELVARLQRQPFLAIVGASGSGKSSLVRAGLVPALRRLRPSAHEGSAPGIVVITPTGAPMASLDDALAEAAAPPWLIVVDQFEELFTICRDEAERSEFVQRLLAALDAGARIVVSLRADFYDRLATYDRLRELASEHQAYLGPLDVDDLRRAIEAPARQGGWQLQPGLVDLILHDVGREPGALPLLSHALQETWQQRRGDQLTLRGYLDSGGVQGAIARTADQTLAGLDDAQATLARDIFLRLTELGEDTPDTRRRASVRELVELQQDPSAARVVLDRLVSARLVVTEGTDAEVAHEALIREWPVLREWLEDDRDALRFHRLLSDAARDWDHSSRDPSLLLRGARLAQAAEWLAARPTASVLERDLIGASQAAALAESAEREAQRQRELDAANRLAETERTRAEEQATSARRLRRRATVLGVVLIVALGLAGVAYLQQQRAEQATVDAENQATLARARELASAADSALPGDPELALLLAVEAVETLRNAETDTALRRAIGASLVRARYTGHVGEVVSVAHTGDSATIMTAGVDSTVRLWDQASGESLAEFRTDGDPPAAAAITDDGRRVAAITDRGVLWVWDARAGEVMTRVEAHAGAGTGISLDEEGERVVTSGFDGGVRIWDVASGELVRELVNDPRAFIDSASFSPDGSLVAIPGPGQLIATVWDSTTGELAVELVGHTDMVIAAAFSPDGTRIATAGNDETVRLWNTATGAMSGVLRGHDNALTSVAFAGPDVVVTGSADGTAAVWDTISLSRIGSMAGHTGTVTSVSGSAEKNLVTTGGSDGTVRSWAVTGQPAAVTLTGFLAPIQHATYSEDGSLVIGSSSDSTARILDADTGETLQVLEHDGLVVTGVFSPDGTLALTASTDGMARVWDVATGELVTTMEGDGVMLMASFDSTGGRVVSTSVDGSVRVWPADGGSEELQIAVASDPSGQTATPAAVFSADGSAVITGDASGRIAMWDAGTGDHINSLVGHTDAVEFLALSEDGERLASASIDGSVRIWDVVREVELLELRGGFANPHKAGFSRDGSRIISGGDDGAAHVWDAVTGAALAAIPSDGRNVLSAVFAPNGRQVLLGNRNATATIHGCDLCGSTDEILELARSRMTRTLTPRERTVYLHEPVVAEEAEPSVPVAVATAPASEAPPTPLAEGDICSFESGPCELPPAVYRPSIFSIPIALRLDGPAHSLGQARSVVLIGLPTGEITLLAGDGTLGYQAESTIRIGSRGSDFIGYLRSKPWLVVSEPEALTVGGRAGLLVEVGSAAGLTEVFDIYFAEPVPFAWVPGEPSQLVTVDVGDTYLVIEGYPFDAASADAFFESFDALVAGISFLDAP